MSFSIENNADPFSLFTIKNETDEVFLQNKIKTWTIALGMCPKFTNKHIEELVKTLKTIFHYDHVMSNLAPSAGKGLLFGSSEPHRAYEVLRYLIDQAQRIVAKVINEAYRKDERGYEGHSTRPRRQREAVWNL